MSEHDEDNAYVGAASEAVRIRDAREAKILRLRDALKQCVDAMDMLDKRQSGEFHIPGETALCIWRDAQGAARQALADDAGRSVTG